MKFQMDIFKKSLIKVYFDLEYTENQFNQILRWIKNNFETTYDKDADLYFGPTQTLDNLQKSFMEYIEQVNKHTKALTGEEACHYYEEWIYMYAEALSAHAINHILKENVDKIFENY
jgi:hypothetical protein